MAALLVPSTALLCSRRKPIPISSKSPTQLNPSSSKPISANHNPAHNPFNYFLPPWKNNPISSSIVGAGVVFSLVTSFAAGDASAAEIPLLASLQLTEPANALSLPTWAIHVSSVVEWVIAMVLVWEYGEKSGYESWKGLSWGMVPLLGGAFCACTWHFFYNADSLSGLVALQAALTVVGNFTMCIAAFRIYKSTQESSENL